MTHSRALTLGPVLFNWAPEVWRDYHFRMADESCADAVYVGEVVCAKRAPFIAPHVEAVVERLGRAGKQVIVSLLAEVMSKVDRRLVAGMLEMEGVTFEVNDASQLAAVAGTPHAVGPFLNAYNEGTLCYLSHRGASIFTMPYELPAASIAVMCPVAAEHGAAVEVQVYGRTPLALSARCYHARAHGLHKDNCQFVCDRDPDGMEIKTLDGAPILTINGIQTMSQKYANLIAETEALAAMGVSRFRLSPDSRDMVAVAQLFRDRLDQRIDAAEAVARLASLRPDVAFADGFLHGRPGTQWSFGGQAAVH
jgi:collagenase-like PrtC family protease